MKTAIRNLVAALLCAALSHSAYADSPKVIATISPLHSLASALMAGTDSAPLLLVEPEVSPHHFHLRPSDAEALEEADAIFWVSEFLESPLAKAIEARAKPGAAVKLLPTLDPHSLIRYDEDDHDEHGHEDEHGHDEHEDEHRDDDDHGHGHDEHKDEHDDHDEHDGHDDHDDHDGHAHGEFDPHVWLSPKLAAELAGTMADALIRADAENAETYRRNLESLRARLSALDSELRGQLSDLPPLRAFVFHAAYGYFQREYGLRIAGTLLGPEAESHGGLSAARIKHLREVAEEKNIRCVFAEPQFNPRTLTPLVRGFEIKTLVLDPLGAGIPVGADAYFETMRNLAKGFAACANA